MNQVLNESKEQQRWNLYGKKRVSAIEADPDRFVVIDSPHRYQEMHHDLMKSLGFLQGKCVLELGCGTGDFSVFLAKQGARMMGVDIGPDLIDASRAMARINNVDCSFKLGSITKLPLKENSYDIVIGIAILHHLSGSDVVRALKETHRVLKDGGRGIFYEPVENSRIFDFMQRLFPAGRKSSGYYRPSILQRKAWAEYLVKYDDRSMTNRELIAAGVQFKEVNLRSFGFLIRLQRLLGRKRRGVLVTTDRIIFKLIPPLRYLCRNVLVEYRK